MSPSAHPEPDYFSLARCYRIAYCIRLLRYRCPEYADQAEIHDRQDVRLSTELHLSALEGVCRNRPSPFLVLPLSVRSWNVGRKVGGGGRGFGVEARSWSCLLLCELRYTDALHERVTETSPQPVVLQLQWSVAGGRSTTNKAVMSSVFGLAVHTAFSPVNKAGIGTLGLGSIRCLCSTCVFDSRLPKPDGEKPMPSRLALIAVIRVIAAQLPVRQIAVGALMVAIRKAR